MDKIRILNVDVLNITRQQLLENLHEGVLITPNLDHLIKLQKDKDFYDCYKKAEWVVCDSNILRLFSKLLKTPFVEAIPGSSKYLKEFCSEYGANYDKFMNSNWNLHLKSRS